MTVAVGLVPAARFALLRAGTRWPDVALDGLEILPDGRIELRRLPQVSPPSLTAPGTARVTGLAFDCGCMLLAADGELLVRLDLACDAREEVPLGFEPAGIARGPGGRVFVADPDGGRIAVLDGRTLEQVDEWTAGLAKPGALAGNDAAVLVVDAGRLLRLDAAGRIEQELMSGGARAVAVGPGGTVYVARTAGAGIRRFDATGAALGAFAQSLRPSALAVEDDVLYAADRDTGEIVLLAASDGRPLGAVVDFAGPVSALAARDGLLALKTGAGDVLLARPTARAAAGALSTVAPLDAGRDAAWLRVGVTAVSPPATDVTIEVATPADPADPPLWRLLPALDALVEPPARLLHVRVRLERRLDAAPGDSPSLAQVHARTAADSLLDRLPAAYARAADGDLLRRLVAFAQAELDDLEQRIGELPRRFSAAAAEPSDLDPLAGWQAFRLPTGATDGDAAGARALVAELPALYAARGTPDGIVRYVEAVTGVRLHLLELFRERALWALGAEQGLGIGTRLAPATLDGLVVGAAAIGESVPDDAQPPGAPLFEETAHRFAAVVAGPSEPTAELEARVRRALEEERPAHTDYHLCFATADARVGIQARVGLDAVVAGAPRGAPLDDHAVLGISARLADTPVR